MKDWLITREIYFSLFLNVKWSQSIYLFLRINALSGENNFVHASHRWSTWPLNTLKIKKLKHPFSSQPFTNLSIASISLIVHISSSHRFVLEHLRYRWPKTCLRTSFTAHGVTWLSSEIDSSRRDRTFVQSGEGTRASRMRPRLSGTGSATSRKEFAGPCIPSVVQAVHQDESPGRRLFYYANTRSFARATLNTTDRLSSTCQTSISRIGQLVCSNMQRIFSQIEMAFTVSDAIRNRD